MPRGRGIFSRRRGRKSQGGAREKGMPAPAPLRPMSMGPGVGDGLVRLGVLGKGERARIEGFDAGHSLVSRLAALGFTPGTEVEMIQNFGQGPVIVGVRDTRIALGRGEASKVLVTAKRATKP